MALLRHGRVLGWGLLALGGAWFGAGWLGCAASEATPDEPRTAATGTGSTTSTGAGGSGTTTGSGTGQGGSAGGTGATGGTGGSGGTAGAGGAGWPSCDTNPGGTPRTIPQIWQDDPTTETPVWVEGAVVTAISYGGCSSGYACQIYLQQDDTYGSWAAGAQHAIKLFVSAATAEHFTAVALADVVDVYAHAIRTTYQGRNELQLQVNNLYPGCAKDVGDGNPQPITGVTLADLTQAAYETTHGPLFVRVSTVSGTPDTPGEIFGIWHTGQYSDAGIEEMTSLSPNCLPSGQFQGLTNGLETAFLYVQGVFGQYVLGPPPDPPLKYEVLYPRYHTEYPQ